jgi:hypothetical protein
MKTKLLTSCLLLFCFSGFYFFSPKQYPDFVFNGDKLKGLSFVAPSKIINETNFEPINNMNAGWVSLMPYGFVPKNSATLQFSMKQDTNKKHQQWWGETPEGIRACIKMAHQKNIKVMLKPHIWLGWGDFTGHLNFKTEKEWQLFENSYSVYIISFAKIAEEEKVDLFCFATEMQSHVKERPAFWNKLILDIKKAYKGPITYAENWDAYKDVPFWNELSYIGVDGYFPLSKFKNPNEAELSKGWTKHLKELGNLAGKINKPILFTEFGYRSCDFATEKPWETDFTLPDNEALQAIAYKVFFDKVWVQKWFAGVFVWKWFPVLDKNPRHKDTFTPQNKQAEVVIRNCFLVSEKQN